MNHSFWEKQSFLSYDFIVVGAGIMGLSVAFELRQKYPHASIVVLERGLLPTGASTRNAGFACFGSPTELMHDINLMGESAALQLVAERVEGLRILEERLGKDKIRKSEFPGYELILEDTLDQEVLEALNKLCYPMFNTLVYADVSPVISSFGFGTSVQQLLQCRQEFQIDSGVMMRNYKDLIVQHNIEIINGADVLAVDHGCVTVKGTFGEIMLNAEHVFICTNAFAQQILPEVDVVPGRGQIIVTKPIPNLPVKGSFHFICSCAKGLK
jgi:glycine/D-amino acid oxidase-like deaminating enzyme